MTHRKLLQSKAIAIENDLRGTLRNFGLTVGVVGKVKFEARIKELVENLPDLAVLVEPLLVVRRVLSEQIVILHRRLLAIVRDDEVWRRLRSERWGNRPSGLWSMDHFAGLDVSVKETSVCIVDDTGKLVREVKVSSEPEALLARLDPFSSSADRPFTEGSGMERGECHRLLRGHAEIRFRRLVFLFTFCCHRRRCCAFLCNARRRRHGLPRQAVCRLLRFRRPRGPSRIAAHAKHAGGCGRQRNRVR
jgi:hypothetical protein